MVIREKFFREIEFKEKTVFKPREKSRSLILGSNKIRLGIGKHLLNINIRDQYDSIKECFLSPIYVYEDEKNREQGGTRGMTEHPRYKIPDYAPARELWILRDPGSSLSPKLFVEERQQEITLY